MSRRSKIKASILAGAGLGAGIWIGHKGMGLVNTKVKRLIEMKRNLQEVEKLGGKIVRGKEKWAKFKSVFNLKPKVAPPKAK